MKSQVVEGHQKVLSAKPRNDELYLHPATASEGGAGKQNVVWWLLGCGGGGAGVWVCLSVRLCVFAGETPHLADRERGGNRQRRSFQKWAPKDSTIWWVPIVPVLGILYAFSPDFYNHRKQLLLLSSLMHFYRWGSPSTMMLPLF